MDKRVSAVQVDSSPATLMPFYDDDLSILYLGGKGEGSIKTHADVLLVESWFHFVL